MGAQHQAVEGYAGMGRFQIGVAVTVIDQVPPAGSIKKLLEHQGLYVAWTHCKQRLRHSWRRDCKCRKDSRDHNSCEVRYADKTQDGWNTRRVFVIIVLC